MSLKTLLEGELEKAQLELAARDMVDQLQEVIKKITKLKIEELPALKEGLRSAIDNNTATQFDSAVSAALQSAIDAVVTSKDQVDQAALAITGEGSMPMAGGGEGDLDQAMNLGDEVPPDGEEEMSPATDAAAGGEEPLGRGKRESRERHMKAMIESLERKIAEARKKGKKPDFLDLDNDGNTTKPMKKAAKDMAESKSSKMMEKGKKKK